MAGTEDGRPILVVDDEERVRSTLRPLLAREGYGVDVAGSAVAAMAAVGERYYDLVLLDLLLCGTRRDSGDRASSGKGGDGPTFEAMDGLDVLAWLHPPERARAVIVITGWKSPEAGARAIRLGAAACLEKPFLGGTLLHEVARALAMEVEGESADPIVRELQRRFPRYGGRELLAERLRRRPRTVSRHVRQVTGRSIPSYIRLLRVRSAAWLLRETQYRVSEIATFVGYNTVEELDRAFRKELGVSPGAYRRRIVGAVNPGDRQLETGNGNFW